MQPVVRVEYRSSFGFLSKEPDEALIRVEVVSADAVEVRVDVVAHEPFVLHQHSLRTELLLKASRPNQLDVGLEDLKVELPERIHRKRVIDEKH